MKTNSRKAESLKKSIKEKKNLNKSNSSSPGGAQKEELKKSKSIDSNQGGIRSPDKNPNSINLPKNINEYRYMIEKYQIRDTDIEWIFELRGYGKKSNFKNLKNVSMNQPSFYNDDFEKYKKKVERELKEKSENPLKLKGNAGDYEHLLLRRLNLPSNPIQFGFDSTLRHFEAFKSVHGPEAPWKTLNISAKKDLLNTYLPPVTKNSIKNVQSIGKYVSRPYEHVYEDSQINGTVVKSKKFKSSKLLTSIVAGEHYSSQPYTYKYPDKNLNSIRHLINDGNLNSLTTWESGLRGYKKYPDKKELEKMAAVAN